MNISYLPYHRIDKEKWDKCIAGSSNRLIYCFSFYLDAMAAHWDGLVLNDYEAVMPLTWKKKIQITYLYQPAFMQQGGIFSGSPVNAVITGQFLEEAMKHFKFAEITLNYGNTLTGENKNLHQGMRTNLVLPLTSYEEMFSNYDSSFKKSLRRIKKFNLRYEKSDDYTAAIKLYEDLYNNRLPSFAAGDYKNISSVCAELHKDNNVITRLALSPSHQLLAAVVLLKDGDRLYNLISCITDEGKKTETNYFLYDKIVEEFSGAGLLLDLEGSDVKGIATFYKKLNPLLQAYPFIKYNELHPFLKVFKK